MAACKAARDGKAVYAASPGLLEDVTDRIIPLADLEEDENDFDGGGDGLDLLLGACLGEDSTPNVVVCTGRELRSLGRAEGTYCSY